MCKKDFKGFPGMRYVFILGAFLGFCVIYIMRAAINVAIVAMVNNTAGHERMDKHHSNECTVARNEFFNNSNTHEFSEKGEFSWSPQFQGVILGSFYYGYFLSPILGGRLADISNGKWVLGFGVLMTSLLTMLLPAIARYSTGLLIATRVIAGFCEGVCFPSLQSLLGRWLPDNERGLLSSIAYNGINIGLIVGMSSTGALCVSDLFGGWPSAFYTAGFFGCIWFLFWSLFISNSPSTSAFISDEELNYIISNQRSNISVKPTTIPWCKILTSLPFWSIVVMSVALDWSFYTLLIDLPTYFANILYFDIKKNGLLSSLLNVPIMFVSVTVGSISDAIIRREITSRIFVRKFCAAVSGLVPALALLGVIFAGCDVTLCFTFLMITKACSGFIISGHLVAAIELSQEYAGTVLGIVNTFSSMTGFLAPLLVGYLIDEQQTIRQWHIVFGIAIAILVVATFVFIFCYTTENEKWTVEEVADSNLTDPKKLPTFKRIETIF